MKVTQQATKVTRITLDEEEILRAIRTFMAEQMTAPTPPQHATYTLSSFPEYHRVTGDHDSDRIVCTVAWTDEIATP